MSSHTLPPIHPGDVLKEEFLQPFGLSINGVARELHVAPNRISHIVNGERSITGDTALRLAAFFETTPEFWMSLQALYDLEIARNLKASQIKREVRRFSPADRATTRSHPAVSRPARSKLISS